MYRMGRLFVEQDIFGRAIGVHFKGSGSYQTRLGALFTLATYILMLVNLLTLFTAFIDGSMQEEKSQSQKIDRFNAEAVVLSDNQFEIVSMVVPALPPEVAQLEAY